MLQVLSRPARVRAAHRLSAVKVAKTKTPGLYEDGAGLRLVVTDRGTKRWALRLTINGRRVERGLGVYPEVGLEDARRKAEALRRAAKEGRDAHSDERRHRLKSGTTFAGAFEAFFCDPTAATRQRQARSAVAQYDARLCLATHWLLAGVGDRGIGRPRRTGADLVRQTRNGLASPATHACRFRQRHSPRTKRARQPLHWYRRRAWYGPSQGEPFQGFALAGRAGIRTRLATELGRSQHQACSGISNTHCRDPAKCEDPCGRRSISTTACGPSPGTTRSRDDERRRAKPTLYLCRITRSPCFAKHG